MIKDWDYESLRVDMTDVDSLAQSYRAIIKHLSPDEYDIYDSFFGVLANKVESRLGKLVCSVSADSCIGLNEVEQEGGDLIDISGSHFLGILNKTRIIQTPHTDIDGSSVVPAMIFDTIPFEDSKYSARNTVQGVAMLYSHLAVPMLGTLVHINRA